MNSERIRNFLTRWETLLAIATILFTMAAGLSVKGLLAPVSLTNAFQVMAEKSLLALPLLLLIIAREIDISVGSVAAFSAVIAGISLEAGLPFWLAVLLAIVTGCLCGALNGFCVTVLGMPALVATLGTLALFRGLCYAILGSEPIVAAVPAEYVQWCYGTVLGWIPNVFIPTLVLIPFFIVALHLRPVGRHIYALGGCPDVAAYAGVRSGKVRFGLFVLSGAVAALAGIIAVGRISQVAPDALVGYELDAITVVFLGGVSFLGGSGRMSGALWGMLLIIMLRQTLLLSGQGQYAQGTAVGLLLIGSLLLANVARRISAWHKGRKLSLAPASAIAN